MENKTVLQTLMAKKEEIEREIQECGDVLVVEGNVGMTGSLLDAEDFPRNDIDIYKIRLARQRINCLQNDYKKLLEEIEVHLNELHTDVRANKAPEFKHSISHKPFIKVTQVDPNSPSSEAGLLVNDEIMQFGSCIETNTDKRLTEIAELVRTSENKIVLLNVLRKHTNAEDPDKIEHEILKIKLIPKKWTGHGLLGCKIVPLE